MVLGLDQQKRKLLSLSLYLIREIYNRTSQLEKTFDSKSIHLIDKGFDPVKEIFDALDLSEEMIGYFSELIALYIEEEMTLQELVLAFEEKMAETENV